MTTNLEIVYNHLEETAGDVVWILIPRFALEVVRGRYHQHYYELPKVTTAELRDEMQALLDAGEAGMSDVLLMSDFIERLDTMNGHLQTVATHINNISDLVTVSLVSSDGSTGLTDAVLSVGGAGGAWDDVEIADLVNAIELIGTAL